VAFVNKSGDEDKQDSKATAGMPIDFDPNDDSIVKVHYDLSAWSIDHRAELSQAMAEAELPHYWDEEELVVPEAVEGAVDSIFEQLESELGPFPIGLDDDDETVEYGLDEWSDADRALLTEQIVESEIPHRWDATTVVVAADAEETVDALLDAIETGELASSDDDAVEPPEGVLSAIFLAANKLAKDPFDAKSRVSLIDLNEVLHPKHPPYALTPRVWTQTVAAVGELVDRFHEDAKGDDVVESDRLDESSDVIGLAQKLREITREYV
jgi:hypothetical protein